MEKSTGKLLESYDTVLLEGAGGLFVPLTDTYSTIDYIADHRLPVILVTSPRLGSINHTVLSLEACRARNIEVAELVYNLYPPTSREITEDTRRYLETIPQPYLSECRVYRNRNAGRVTRAQNFRNK